jgi:hypothetical protein
VAIARWSENGRIVEIGAGTGYTASRLANCGCDVVAFDIDPAPSPSNQWFAGSPSWHEVRQADHTIVVGHTDRMLLMVWPTSRETWAADTVELFFQGGGDRVAFVGEPPGGRTGDDRFHRLIGTLERCYQCAYGLDSIACVCGVTPRFQVVETVPIPNWDGCEDQLHLLTRVPERLGRRRRWRR